MIKAINLKVEQLPNLSVIDIQYPNFTWNVKGANEQTAFQVMLSVDSHNVYDSGKITESKMTFKYTKKLLSRSKVCFKIRLWDENDEVGEWSLPMNFEMGLLNGSDWEAKWIDPEVNIEVNDRQPASYLKKEFNLESV